MSETLFEKIINREIPADIIYEDDLSIVIKDIHPQAPTHLLIIPKKAIPKLSDSSIEDQEVLGHLMLVAGKVAEQLNLCLLYTSPSPRDQRGSRMPSSA